MDVPIDKVSYKAMTEKPTDQVNDILDISRLLGIAADTRIF